MSGITKYKLVGLDTNIFIYHFEDNPEFVRYTQLIFGGLSKNKFQAVTSIISVIEVLSYPAPVQVLTSIEEGFKTTPNLTIYDVNHDIAIEAARIRRIYRLRLPDAVQLATALKVKAQAFVSNDERLKKFKELPIILLGKDIRRGKNL